MVVPEGKKRGFLGGGGGGLVEEKRYLMIACLLSFPRFFVNVVTSCGGFPFLGVEFSQNPTT
ncbi:hypothetical protein ACQ1Z4_14125, partial [Enterococcus faecalis]